MITQKKGIRLLLISKILLVTILWIPTLYGQTNDRIENALAAIHSVVVNNPTLKGNDLYTKLTKEASNAVILLLSDKIELLKQADQRSPNLVDAIILLIANDKSLKDFSKIKKDIPAKYYAKIESLLPKAPSKNVSKPVIPGVSVTAILNKIDDSKFKERQGKLLDLSTMNINNLQGLSDVPGIADIVALDLSHNFLTQLTSKDFLKSDGSPIAPQLRRLYLNDNHIESIEPLKGLNALEILNLPNNYLYDIPSDAFESTPKLTTLALNYNSLTELDPMMVKNLTNLVNLYLDHNQLDDIHPEFLALKNLKLLQLSNNLIQDIPQDTIDQLNKNTTVFLHHNKLTSDTKKALTRAKTAKGLQLEF